MGRPPLHVKATSVRLTADVRQRIADLVGANRMGAFIREAVENELRRREQAGSSASAHNPQLPRARPKASTSD
jgi:predicted DNA-binding protein